MLRYNSYVLGCEVELLSVTSKFYSIFSEKALKIVKDILIKSEHFKSIFFNGEDSESYKTVRGAFKHSENFSFYLIAFRLSTFLKPT